MQGGYGVNGSLFSNNKLGGNGGIGVLYRISLTNDKNAVIEGGSAGGGGLAGPGKTSTFDGKAGKSGEDGLSVKNGSN